MGKVTVRAFTLIEVMISVAIITILLTLTSSTHLAYTWLVRETNYSAALRQMNIQKKNIENLPFNNFPPEILTVNENREIELSNKDIISKTVEITVLSKETGLYTVPVSSASYSIDEKNGKIRFNNNDCNGKEVLIKYSFLLPDCGECAVVSSSSPYEATLFNNPVLSVKKVELIRGDTFTVISPEFYKITSPDKITFNKAYKGKPVRITYNGGKIRNICTGDFLDDTLIMVYRKSDIKLIKITEDYGSKENIENIFLSVNK